MWHLVFRGCCNLAIGHLMAVAAVNHFTTPKKMLQTTIQQNMKSVNMQQLAR